MEIESMKIILENFDSILSDLETNYSKNGSNLTKNYSIYKSMITNLFSKNQSSLINIENISDSCVNFLLEQSVNYPWRKISFRDIKYFHEKYCE